MKKIIGIYKITSPSGKVYIGQSIDIEKRFNIYRFLSCKSQKKLYASFLRYGVENHTFEIIMECKKNELNYYERHYQEYYNVLDEYGLNLKYTQVAEKKQVYSEETRKKLSQNHVSKKEGYVNHMKGKTHSEETKRKISEKSKGKKMSEDAKIKMSLTRNLENSCGRKKVINIETGEIYISISECIRSTGAKKLFEKLNGSRKNKTPFRYYEKIIN